MAPPASACDGGGGDSEGLSFWNGIAAISNRKRLSRSVVRLRSNTTVARYGKFKAHMCSNAAWSCLLNCGKERRRWVRRRAGHSDPGKGLWGARQGSLTQDCLHAYVVPTRHFWSARSLARTVPPFPSPATCALPAGGKVVSAAAVRYLRLAYG